ncbi:CapA family protein, partial [Flavobacteriaceae bacterium]|nr:CapA family protein [Flavobacteriaceae bacterium]
HKVGVISYADYEFGIVTDESPGANPFSFITAYNDINSLKSKVDYIITLLHDGKEYYPYASPELQQICQHLVDLGSDIVVCQHSHIIGAVEAYKSGTIVYGQGNFLFDFRNNRTSIWSYGFFIKIKIDGKNKTIDLLPFKQNYPGVSKLNKEEERLFYNTINERAKNVTNKVFIKKSWEDFILSQKANYLSVAFGHNLFFSRILKKIGLDDYLISNKVALIVLNFLRSRVHKESFVSILENLIKNKK